MSIQIRLPRIFKNFFFRPRGQLNCATIENEVIDLIDFTRVGTDRRATRKRQPKD